jgi:hypothetical protein
MTQMRPKITIGLAALALTTAVAAVPASAQQSQQKPNAQQQSSARPLFSFVPEDTARYYGWNDDGLVVSPNAQQQSGARALFNSVPKDTARYYGGLIVTPTGRQ